MNSTPLPITVLDFKDAYFSCKITVTPTAEGYTHDWNYTIVKGKRQFPERQRQPSCTYATRELACDYAIRAVLKHIGTNYRMQNYLEAWNDMRTLRHSARHRSIDPYHYLPMLT